MAKKLEKFIITFATISCVTASFEIPIYRRGLIDTEILGDGLRGNYNGRNPWNNETIALQKFMDAEYFGIIRIGNPAKEFKIIFDTTWADTWVPSSHCGLLEMACMIHARYDGTKSSTYKEDGRRFSTGNSSNDLQGFVSQDHFNLAHLTVKNQTFVEMTHIPWLPYGFSKADGIVGLAFPNLRIVKSPTFFSNMLRQSLIQQPVFTFYFNRDPTTERAGRLILGATERKYVNGSLTAVPVIEKLYWKIKLDSIIVDAKSKSYPFCKNSCEAIFDTSTNTITGPTNEVDRINQLLGARSFIPPIFKMNRYMVDCRNFAKLSPIDFVMAGQTFTIHSKYYVQHLTYESIEVCLSPFVPSDQTFWEIGGAFLMQFYTEYDYNTGQVMVGKTKY